MDRNTHAGQAIYNRVTLSFYDLAVLSISNPLIWRCPTRHILDLYNSHVTNSHLDAGVGTGWYLDKCKFSSQEPRIGLMDLNPKSLDAASSRIVRYRPERYQADVLQALGAPAQRFRSISITYLLHCLPGTIVEKAAVFDHLLPWLRPGGVVFGATLLSQGVQKSKSAETLMHIYNRLGVFSNSKDSAVDLEMVLAHRFQKSQVKLVGCCALFVAEA